MMKGKAVRASFRIDAAILRLFAHAAVISPRFRQGRELRGFIAAPL
jgi:hypothetical protein